MDRRGSSAVAAVVAVLALAVLVTVFVLGQRPTGTPSAVASPTPTSEPTRTPGGTATPVTTATAGAPTATASPRTTTYASQLGYTVELPAGWRRSDLQSRTAPDPRGDPELLATDVFTVRTPEDERQAMADTHVGFGPLYAYTAFVRIYRNTDGLTPRAFAQREQGRFGFEVVSVEDITFEGRPAAKTTWRYPPSGTRTSYAVYVQDATRRMWVIGYYLAPDDMRVPAGATEAAVRGIVESFRSIAR